MKKAAIKCTLKDLGNPGVVTRSMLSIRVESENDANEIAKKFTAEPHVFDVNIEKNNVTVNLFDTTLEKFGPRQENLFKTYRYKKTALDMINNCLSGFQQNWS